MMRASEVTDGEEIQFVAAIGGDTATSLAQLEETSGYIYQSR